MAKTKPKRIKKFNPLKQLELVARSKLKNRAIVKFNDDELVAMIDLQGNIQTSDLTSIAALTKVKHVWSVYLLVAGVNSFSKRYSKSEIVTTKHPYFHHELADLLTEHHKTLIHNFNHQHFVGCGWIALPDGSDMNEQQAFNIFEKLGLWDGVCFDEILHQVPGQTAA